MSAFDKYSRVEVVLGQSGFHQTLNTNRLALGALTRLNNACLYNYAVRPGGGAVKVGTPTPDGATARRAIDYAPDAIVQRTVVKTSAGNIYKDDGTGSNWASLASGLGDVRAVSFSQAGAEKAGKSRKLFYADGTSIPQVLTGDGAAMAAIAKPNADWTGTHQPRFFFSHGSYNWAGGVDNAPHTLYRSLQGDHENFVDGVSVGDGLAYTLVLGPNPLRELYLTGGTSYKGAAIVWKYPFGCYLIDTTSDPASANWTPVRTAEAGLASPHAFAMVEDDILWVDPEGGWHSLSQALLSSQKSSVKATDISFAKLEDYMSSVLDPTYAASMDLVAHPDRQEVLLAFPIAGGAKTRRLHYDGNNRDVVGPNWLTWDRDRNEALFRRVVNGENVIAMFDNVGQLWHLDQSARDKASAAYTFEFWIADNDFGQQVQGWAGRKKNLRAIQVEYMPVTTATMTLEIWCDSVKTQTLTIALPNAGSAVLPVVLPFTLNPTFVQSTRPRRLVGRGRRIGIRGYWTQADADVAITKVILYADLSST